MNAAKKSSSFLLIFLVASSLLAIQAASATDAKPSVPVFTIRYVDRSYDIPPTYGVDQYTGKSIITTYGEHVDNRAFEFTIKNQPFTSYTDENGTKFGLFYNFRFKGQYGHDWSYYPDTSHTYGRFTGTFPNTEASNSEYTVILINIPSMTSYPPSTPGIATGATVEFQVQAINGHINTESTGMLAGDYFGFDGEQSEWSNTQTIAVGQSASTTTPISTPQPQQPSSSNSTYTPPPTILPTQNPTQNATVIPLQPNVQSGFTLEPDWSMGIIAVLAVAVVVLAVVVLVQRKRSG